MPLSGRGSTVATSSLATPRRCSAHAAWLSVILLCIKREFAPVEQYHYCLHASARRSCGCKPCLSCNTRLAGSTSQRASPAAHAC